MQQAITDYIPLAEKFLQHWSDAEAALEKALTLDDGATREELEGLKTILLDVQSTITETENDRQGAIQQRNSARAEALPIARQVRKSILATIPSSEEARQLPGRLPSLTEDVAKQLVVLRDVKSVWGRVNALPAGKYPSLTPPLVVLVDLKGAEVKISLEHYSATVARLAAAATTLNTAEQALTQEQQNRRKVIERLNAIFKAYRTLIRGIFPKTSAIYRSLP